MTDAARERELLLKVAKLAGEGRADECRVLYSTILALSRSEQQRVIGGASSTVEKIEKALKDTPSMFPDTATVACQGVEGRVFTDSRAKALRLAGDHVLPHIRGRI